MTANPKGVGGGLQENNLNVQKRNFRKQTINALPCHLAQFDVASWYAGMLVGLVKALKWRSEW